MSVRLPFFLFIAIAGPWAVACQGADGAAGTGNAGEEGSGAASRVLMGPFPETQPGSDVEGARQWQRGEGWYPQDPQELSREVAELLSAVSGPAPRAARAILTPHASLVASGPVAAKVYARVTEPDVIVVIAPNHGRRGEIAAVWPEGPWLMPGVALEVDEAASQRLEELAAGELAFDREAFAHENAHPSEMQMPFISRLFPSAELVVVSFFDHQAVTYPETSLETLRQVGEAVAELVTDIESGGREVLLAGTTDLTHYEPVDVAEREDADLMEPIEALDDAALAQVVREGELSICGEVAVSVWAHALRELGYSALDYSVRDDSREITGSDAVVGYPGGIVWRADE